MRFLKSFALALIVVLPGCNDLTDPTPTIAGEYSYTASTGSGVTIRRGTVVIHDEDRRTARFTGTFVFTNNAGESVSGGVNGAFINRERIWFQLLTERGVFHEADYVGGRANGEIFLQGLTYEAAGVTFVLTRVR